MKRHHKANKKFQKNRKQIKGKLAKKEKVFANNTIVSYINNKRLLPFPERYRCKLHTTLPLEFKSGYANNFHAAGPPTIEPLAIKMNSVYLPYDTSVNLTAFGTGLTVATLDGVNFATVAPTGFTAMSTLYGGWRIYRSKIEVTMIPQSIVDNINLCILPQNNTNVALTQTQFAYFAAQPFSKNMVIQCNSGKYTLKNSVSQHQLLGVRRQAIEDDLSSNFESPAGSNDVQTQMWYRIIWETSDGAVLVNPIGCLVKTTHYVEFFQPNYQAIV